MGLFHHLSSFLGKLFLGRQRTIQVYIIDVTTAASSNDLYLRSVNRFSSARPRGSNTEAHLRHHRLYHHVLQRLKTL